MRHRRDDILTNEAQCDAWPLPLGDTLVDKWTNTDCLDCLWEGAMMGNKTAAARRITLLGFGKTPAPAAPNPAPSAYVSDVPDTQKGFKGSSSLGWDEDWD